MEQPKKRNRTLIVLAVAGALVLGCLVCVALGAIGGKGKATPTAMARAGQPAEAAGEPAETAGPSATPAPTDTPAPTRTPKPTASPEPTATTESGPPIEVQLYALEIGRTTTKMAEALTAVGELASAPRFTDQEWVLEIATQMATIKFLHKQLTAMEDVPADMADIHATLLSGTADFDRAMDLLAGGIDALDVNQINAATELMISGTRKMQAATTLVLDYNAQFEDD